METLTAKTEQLQISNATFAPKKQPGSIGTTCNLKTNMWRLTLKPNVPLYKYDVRMNVLFPDDKSKELTKQTKDDYNEQIRKSCTVRIYKKICAEQRGVFGTASFYDRAAILFSLEQLKEVELTLAPDFITNVPFDGHIGYSVALKKCQDGYQTSTNDVNKAVSSRPGDQDVTIFEALNIILGQEALMNQDKWVTYGNAGHYLMDDRDAGFNCKASLNFFADEGKYLGIGAKKAVKVVEGQKGEKCAPYVGVEVIKTAFHGDDQPLSDKMITFIRSQRGDQSTAIKAVRNLIKGLFVYTIHTKRPQSFQILSLTNNANETSIDVDGKKITVAQYYKSKYSQLKHPDLPLIVTRLRGRDSYFPAELLRIGASQRVTTAQQTPLQMQEMIKNCAIHPDQRFFQCHKMKDVLNINSGSAALKNVGITVATEPAVIAGRQLNSPTIVFGENKPVKSADNAKWSGDLMRYEKPASLSKWTVVLFLHQRDAAHFDHATYIKKLADRMQKFGMSVAKPEVISETSTNQQSVVNIITKAATAAKELVFFISSDNVALHDFIKYQGSQHQVLTQEVRLSKCVAVLERGQNQTLDNVVNKTNLKLGGVNYSVVLPGPGPLQNLLSLSPNQRKLYIGIELSHPAPLSAAERARNVGYRTPSVLGWGANYAKHPQYFLGDYRYVKPRESDMIGQELYNLARYVVTQFRVNNNMIPPSHIVLYLNGVSQGQWALVCTSYLDQLKKACKSLNEKYTPQFTVMVVSKDHNERLFKKDIPQSQRPADKNVAPGTVVDTVIVSPSVSEFYLNSHSAFQGTAKTPKYSILVDDANLSMDQVESMTHGLCFMHSIVNMAISIPAPLKVAGECAKRGLNVFHQFTDGTEDGLDLAKYNNVVNIGKRLGSVRYNA
ncbi:unnamed protein product [Auanema sp. JU1783]|nr:unnamed protein product [Auanema sp. JU1783]